MSEQLEQIKLEKLKLLEEKARVVRGLPHIYGYKDYKWSREFLDSDDKTILLTAANQLGKSTSQIRRVLDYATNVHAWPKRFRRSPRQFWYLYPTAQIATAEFHTKWKPDILPKDSFKDDPQYGWRAEFKNRGDISAIYFNSGVALYFKTYAQDAQHLQAGTVDYVACFTAGTQISVPTGTCSIENLKVGDLVDTHLGYRKISKVYVSEKKVIERSFSNGVTIQATFDHPFLTENRGWVQFGNLTHEDICFSVPECLINSLKSSYSKELSTTDTQNTKTTEPKIILGMEEKPSMYQYGKATLSKKFQKDTSFITRTLTRLITLLKTCNYSLEKSTQKFTNLKNGSLRKNTQKFVSIVEKILLRGVVKSQLDSALGDVANTHGLSIESAQDAILHLRQGKTLIKCSVLKDVPIKQLGIKSVYNIQVEESHTYFANGIFVHNCDEELPLELWDEINFRRNAVDGYFSMVFTATLGQEFWRLAMEPKHGEQEAMPFAKKLRASLFDCQFFMDGTPSHWTLEKINRTIAMCKSEAEVQRRVYGRFVKDEGLKYPSFDRARNIVSPSPVPAHWPVYVGVDIGAGGDENHPSAITFVAVRPDYKYARIFRHWRGDDKVYTMSDVASKYMELSQDLNVTAAFYDYHAKDFKTITDRMGLSFIPAEKKHDVGEQIINVLFKNGMLEIEGTVENQPIVNELLSLQLGTDKRKAKDDSVDSMRYALTKIPFDFSHVGYVPVREVVRAKQLDPHEIAQAERNKDRLRMFASGEKSGLNEVQDEIRDWNEIIGADTTHYEDFF